MGQPAIGRSGEDSLDLIRKAVGGLPTVSQRPGRVAAFPLLLRFGEEPLPLFWRLGLIQLSQDSSLGCTRVFHVVELKSST